jgi:hypothetical protein
VPGQEEYFEDPTALYYEREWRMVADNQALQPWMFQTTEGLFFNFNEEYLAYIVIPRGYKKSIPTEVVAGYKAGCVPAILEYEDLQHM